MEIKKSLVICIGLLLLIVGIYLMYIVFTHTLDYLECKDLKEGLSFMQNPSEAKCDCNFVSNQCYTTMRVSWYFNSQTNETLELKQPHKSVFKEWG